MQEQQEVLIHKQQHLVEQVQYHLKAVGLPAGLSLNETTGAVTGTPTTAGSYDVSVYGLDANGNYSVAYTGTIVIS